MDDIQKKASYWQSAVFDENTRQKVAALVDSNQEELEDSFYKDLAFGTGGMRGVMGVGTNRINKYTLGRNTQGLANLLKTKFPEETIKVVIAYDCRHNSRAFAQIVADVFSANDIQVYLFSELRPTPELSFAVRHLKGHCGIVLTASHNPPEYNGYKVYWQDGGQLVPPEADQVIEAISALDFKDIKFEANRGLINIIDHQVDEAFLNAAVQHTSFGTAAEAKADLKIVYTPLHGTSVKLIPPALKKAGFTNVHIVEAQAEPNGDFPTVDSPNPEEPAALEMALQLAEKVEADIVIGTDPDSDRLGVAVRDLEGKMTLLNGNQTMVMMTDFLLQNYQNDGFEGNEFIASTVVSTPLMSKLGAAYGVECKLGLTGFKWIAKMVKDCPDQKFIGGGEESFGFMVSDFVRDKDAVSATLLACEIAAKAKADDSSFYRELLKLYTVHGVYRERLISLVRKGQKGAAEIERMMQNLRQNPPTSFAGIRVRKFEDYAVSRSLDLESNKETTLKMPKSNVLIFYLEDGSQIAARPSGTEPKIKFYVSVNATAKDVEEYPAVQNQLDQGIDRLLEEFDFEG